VTWIRSIFLSYTRELLHPSQFLFNCNHFISVNCRMIKKSFFTTIRRVIECDSRYRDITVNCRIVITTISEPTNDQKIVFYNSLLQQLFNRYYNNYYRRVIECDSRYHDITSFMFLFKDMYQ
jgi:hypothetical protein